MTSDHHAPRKAGNVRQDLIVIEDHNPGWADRFETQKVAVEGAVRDWLVAPVEHIGSTSIPGLPAKPIIDMLAVIDDYQAFKPALSALERIGWAPAPEPADEDRRKWSACFPNVEHRTHHLHVVERDSEAGGTGCCSGITSGLTMRMQSDTQS